MRESRFRLIALLPVLIALFAIYGIIPLPTQTFAGMDFLNLSFPRVLLAKTMVINGHLPLWNWHEWGGAPLLATHLGALAYPPTWIAALLPLPYGLQLFVFIHLCLAGAGAWMLARTVFRLEDTPACYAGIAYAGSAFFMGRIEQFQVIAVNCLFPWLLLCLWQTVYGRRGRLWLPLVWAMMLLAGHPQFAVLNLGGAVGFLLLLSLFPSHPGNNPGSREGWRFVSRLNIYGWMRAVIYGALGTAVAAVQLLPTAELGQQSERLWPHADPTSPELSWSHLPALLIPRYYNLITHHGGRVIGYTELGLYAGLLTVPLGLAGLWFALRGPVTSTTSRQTLRPLAMAAAAVWVGALWIALGKHAGLGRLIYDHVPFLRQSRGAARSLNVAALMLALLSAVGVQGFYRLWCSRQRRIALRLTLPWPALLLCGVTAADLALCQADWLRSVTIPRDVIDAPALIPPDVRHHLVTTHDRIYRFMAYDSDFYLDDTARAVRERRARLQPNLAGLPAVYLTDGYEEGLLPSRRKANLLRRYNRNLRGPAPDSALLAWMGATTMLTEYPLQPEREGWISAGPPFLRPATVPATAPDVVAQYQWWRSPYRPAAFLSLDRLFTTTAEAEQFLEQVARDFPLSDRSPVPAGRAFVSHALQGVAAEEFNRAAQDFLLVEGGHTENALQATITTPTKRALALLSPSPGWKIAAEKLPVGEIKPLSSLFYVVQLNDKAAVPTTLNLIYYPFSFHLGLFISLSAGVLYVITILEHRCQRTRNTGSKKTHD